ncbi:MAG: creatininase family protein [Rhodospirillales bacterium]|nr:creatininase family protein [Rhodospirillales bacterium]
MKLWQDMTSREIAALDPARTVAVLPIAAIEQHGPHLPLGTDAEINAGILVRARALALDGLPALVLPALAVGKSNEHGDFAGTLSLSAETLLQSVTEIAESVARAGLRKIVLFNSHGGQPQIADIVAQDLRARLGMAAAVANSWRMMRPAEFFPMVECEGGIHGGAIETSLMLHLRPDLVRRDAIGDFPSAARALAAAHPELAAGGRFRFAWQAQDLNPAGTVGDARLANVDAGRVLAEQAASALVALVADLSRLDMGILKTRP